MKTDLTRGEIVIFNTSCNTKTGNKIRKGDKGTIKNIASKNGIPAIELKEYPESIFSPNLFI
jgi:hypothetical protein